MADKGFTTLQEGGQVGVIYRPDDPAPVGAIMRGDFQRLLGNVVTVSSRGVRTLHVVTDVRYTEGETHLSFLQNRPA